MAKYFVFMSLTERGVASLESLPNEFIQALEVAQHGQDENIASASVYALFGGPFDFLAECEAGVFEDAAHYALTLAMTGLVRTTTPQTYNMDYFNSNLRTRLGKMAP
jgi:uncharacterized protein with GYD domain